MLLTPSVGTVTVSRSILPPSMATTRAGAITAPLVNTEANSSSTQRTLQLLLRRTARSTKRKDGERVAHRKKGMTREVNDIELRDLGFMAAGHVHSGST